MTREGEAVLYAVAVIQAVRDSERLFAERER